MPSVIVPRASPVSSMRKSLLKWGVASNRIEVGPTEMQSPSPPSSPRSILIDLPAEYVMDGYVEIQDDVVLSVDPSIASLLANPSRLQDAVGKSITHFALCCCGGDRSAMSVFLDTVAGSRARCRTPSVVSGKQLEWAAFKSKERVNRCVLLATVREHQVLDKATNLRLEAVHAVQRRWIDELEKEKEQALRNDLLEQEKRGLESDHLKERNQRLEAESKVIEERNLRLEAEQVAQSKRINELEEEYAQALRNDLLEQEKRRSESDLLKERNQRLEAESKVIEERNVVQGNWIDELEKEYVQALRNDLLEQEKRRSESDLLKERNQRLEAESKVIEEGNLRLEAEQVVQRKRIDELEKEKERALRNDLQREADLLKEKNLRLEAEIHADSHLNHTLKV
jgi:hypothetical protein